MIETETASQPVEVGLGIWTLESSHLNPRPWQWLYRKDLATHLEVAERLDFDCLWFAEHHHWASGYLPSPLPVFASCLARTERIAIGSGVLILPFHSPERVAQACTVMESIAPGRLRLALGLGYSLREFDAAGVSKRARARLMESGLEALTGELSGSLGETELWYGTFQPKGIERAARFGCSLYMFGIHDLDQLRVARELWLSKLQPRPGQTPRVGVCVPVWVSDDEEELKAARVREAETHRHYWFNSIRDEQGAASSSLDMSAAADEQRAALSGVGTPDEVAEKLSRFIEAGADTLVLWVQMPRTDGALLAEQLERLASEVVPKLRSLR